MGKSRSARLMPGRSRMSCAIGPSICAEHYEIGQSQETVDMVRRTWPELKVASGDVADSPFPDNHFTGVISLGVVEHFPEGMEAVDAIGASPVAGDRAVVAWGGLSCGCGSGGERLAGAGAPAVLAMHGDISMETVERFLPSFFISVDFSSTTISSPLLITPMRSAISSASSM